MKFTTTLKLFFFLSSFFLSDIGKAQTNKESKLLGKWGFQRYEFLNVDSDTISMKKDSKGIILIFEKDKKFTTKMKFNGAETLVGTGLYSVSEDGKYLYQNGEEVEIILLDEKELVIKVPGAVIMHLKKITVKK